LVPQEKLSWKRAGIGDRRSQNLTKNLTADNTDYTDFH
jgi:hypothetical protein